MTPTPPEVIPNGCSSGRCRSAGREIMMAWEAKL